MPLSMTGFGSYTTTLPVSGGEKVSVTVELKSLNTRFFELNAKLPSSLSYLEIPIANDLKQKLVRGRVFLSIKIGGSGDAFERVVPVSKVVKDYIAAAKMLKKKFKLQGDLEVSDVVFLDNVFSFEREKIGKSFEAAVLKTVAKVIDDLISSRKSEGKRLKTDLKKRFDLCAKHIEEIKKLFTIFMKQKKEELNDMMILAKNGDIGAEQQLGDYYDLINKIDIHEEIVRFKSHLKRVQQILVDKNVEKGKRLEFTLQELSRETNTIAAKCSHVKISPIAVDMKVELEKVREQVQNLV